MTIDLAWQGPFSYHELIYSVSHKFAGSALSSCNRPGVYLHVSEVDGEKCVDYAGRSLSSVVMRQIDHFTNWIGGRYTFPFYCRGAKTLVPDVVKNPEYVDILLSREDFIEHVSACYDSSFNICLYFAVNFYDDNNKKDVVKAAERYLLYRFQPLTTKNGTLSPLYAPYTFSMGGVLAGRNTEFQTNNKRVFQSRTEDSLFNGRCFSHLP